AAAAGKSAAPARDKETAAERIRSRVKEARVDVDEITGSPKFIGSQQEFLSGPNGSGRAISTASINAIPASDPHRVVKAFVNEHNALFGHGAEALHAARLQDDYTTGHNGMGPVVRAQQLDGVPAVEEVLKAHST